MFQQTGALSSVNFNQIQGTMVPGYDIADFRKIRAELSEIKEELGRHDTSDQISQEIVLWCETFEAFFKKTAREDHDVKPVLEKAVQLMKRILRCALPPHLPLDEEAVLGSDGRVYNISSLQANRDRELYRDRFDPALFTTSPHPLVHFMVRWLAGQDNTEINALGDELLLRLQSPPSRREKREQRGLKRAEKLEQFEKEVRARIEKEMERHEAALKLTMEENLVDMQAVDKRISDLSAQAFSLIEQFNESLKELEDEKRGFEEAAKNLIQRTDLIEMKISDLEVSTQELKHGIDSLNEKINEREKAQEESLLKTVMITVVCIAVSLLLPEGMGFIPISGGAAFRIFIDNKEKK